MAERQRDVECGGRNIELGSRHVWGEVLMTVAAGPRGGGGLTEYEFCCNIGFGVNTALQGASAKFFF